MFIEARKQQKAMVAYEKALQWQELFMLAVETGMSEEHLEETAYRISGERTLFERTENQLKQFPVEDLVSKRRHPEAATVLLDYARDVRKAVIALVSGNGFSEARRVVGAPL